jgi:integrase
MITSAEKRRWKVSPNAAFEDFLNTPSFQELGRRAPARNENGDTYALSASSIKVYCGLFRKVVAWLDLQGLSIFDADVSHLLSFLDSSDLVDGKGRRGKKRSLIRLRYLRLLERVFDYLATPENPARQAAHYIDKAPDAAGANLPTQALASEQIAAFMAALPELGNTPSRWKRRRDRAILATMLGAGLRVSEILTLKRSDVGQMAPDGTIPITLARGRASGLARKHVTILRAETTCEVLEWLALRKQLRIAGPLMFPAAIDGSALTRMTVYRMSRQTFLDAGIPVHHSGGRTLRNTFAVRELLNETPIEAVSEYLGHYENRSIETYVAAKVRVK